MSNKEVADIPILVGTGISDQYEAGKFYKTKIKFSTYIPYNIQRSMKKLLGDIKRHCDENGYDFNTVLKNTYILGPIYTNGDIQIGFTGSSKFSRTKKIEPNHYTLPRELFEESGLYFNNNHRELNIIRSIDDFESVNQTIEYGQSQDIITNRFKLFDYNKLGINDEDEVNKLKKQRKHASSLIYMNNLSKFEEIYQDVKESFETMQHLFVDDKITGIGCISLFQAIEYMKSEGKLSTFSFRSTKRSTKRSAKRSTKRSAKRRNSTKRSAKRRNSTKTSAKRKISATKKRSTKRKGKMKKKKERKFQVY